MTVIVKRCCHNLVAPTKENRSNPALKVCHICLPPKPRKEYKPRPLPNEIKARPGKTSIKNLDRWIKGIVSKYIGTYHMDDFKVEQGTAKQYTGRRSDYKEEMTNEAYKAVLNARKNQAEKCKDAGYLKTVIINALSGYEQGSRLKRDTTDNILDEPIPPEIVAPDQFACNEARQDVESLTKLAKLSNSESACLELKYGYSRGAEFQREDGKEMSIARIAYHMDQSETWVRARLTAAQIKLEVAKEPFRTSRTIQPSQSATPLIIVPVSKP